MADFQVTARLIGKPGKLLDDQELLRDIRRTNDRFAKRLKRRFQKTVRTFAHPVIFHQRTRSRDLMVEVFTTDEIYFYLDQGTSIRYAVMTKDFSPKTRPGVLDSFPGSGGLAYFDFRNPRPGLEPRRFAETIEDEQGSQYERAIDADIERAITRNT